MFSLRSYCNNSWGAQTGLTIQGQDSGSQINLSGPIGKDQELTAVALGLRGRVARMEKWTNVSFPLQSIAYNDATVRAISGNGEGKYMSGKL